MNNIDNIIGNENDDDDDDDDDDDGDDNIKTNNRIILGHIIEFIEYCCYNILCFDDSVR